ncbi:MAG: class I SAM-dependent methyltransferase [Bacteroidota bacterium]
MDNFFEANQKTWNARVPYHLDSDFYNLEAFRKGETSLNATELNEIGELVEGKTLLHLQCHFGQDTLSFARMGAKATGIDFSDKALEAARKLNDELGLDAKFVQSNVLELDKNLEGQFDIVFTSYGVLGWLPDLDKWASQVNHFLKPGGFFYIVEFHPVIYLLDFDTLELTFPYFNVGEFEEDISGTYADNDADIKGKEYFWCHSLQEVITPLRERGLELEFFHEFPFSSYNCFPNMIETGKGQHQFERYVGKLPYMFSLKMQKPKNA